DAVATDVADFHRALADARVAAAPADRARRLEEAVALYTGDFLPGFYEDWVIQEQQHLHDLCFEALRSLTALLPREGAADATLHHARRAAAMEPLHEPCRRELIRLLVAADRLAEAREQYADLERRLCH